MRKLIVAAAFGLVAILVAVASAAQAQQPRFREVQVAEGAFSRGDAVPQWADPLPMPPGERGKPVLVRLADDL
jgi:hypothetical protein